MKPRDLDVVVVGGGPGGLRAAAALSATEARIAIFDRMPSLGRKFLIAGRGGLNLTHSEPVANFPARYGDEIARWRSMLADFGPAETRAWAEGLGVETYVGTSGRVFPRGQQAARLLRRWLSQLRERGVETHAKHHWNALHREVDGRWRVGFANQPDATAVVVILALGGASWPETGSDGTWPAILAEKGVKFRAWQPANCGWEVEWDAPLLAEAEGKPLKNIEATAGGTRVAGELLVTKYGLEGGALYQLGRDLREQPDLTIDLKPTLSREQLTAKPRSAWKLSACAQAMLAFARRHNPGRAEAELVKSLKLPLLRPRPIAEAISSAGGLCWSELDDDLMIRKLPGVFAAGEMINWEAPTGGYLLQGCFATGQRAARGAGKFLAAGRRKSFERPL
jgi:uncharacterized flavoprotein (TIGR03862 family)